MNRIRSNWRTWAVSAVLIAVLYGVFKGLNVLLMALLDWRGGDYRNSVGTAFTLGMAVALFVFPLLRRPVNALYRRFAPAPAKN